MKELPKGYIAKDSEPDILKRWDASGFANPDNLPGMRKESFSITLPPPNATAKLHLGHTVMIALQDLLIRFQRMRGKKALWVPGTDHAAIATQNMVEKELKKEGKRRQDLGREAFLKQVEEYVENQRGTIKEQIHRMGASADWSRDRFTLDKESSAAVAEAFKRLYDAGLIYRGLRVVNWCPKDQSTLADDEVEHEERPTMLYSFKYDAKFPFAIATTRPETKLGDTAVAVNPEDERYKKYTGKTFTVEIGGMKRDIRVVADRNVDPEYGTGALGVTPAHSAADEAIGKREKLPSIKVIGEDGKMAAEAGPHYAGLKILEAREKLIAELKTAGLVEREEQIVHNLSVCYRCGTPVEPLPSEQWFVAVDKEVPFPDGKKSTLKQRAIDAVRSGEIEIVPKHFEKTYFHWMENLHDWCISRQIWYGHRIPVSQRANGEIEWKPSEDTLDTWFSSGLWTFSTLGWPKETKDLKAFHPTDVMETGYDILFFWVARMILMSTYLVGEVPFKTVYLHGLVRDKQGRKMSKSLGNGIDPVEMAEKYGADAVRLSLIIGTSPGNDQRLAEDKIAGFRNYANKIWNIGRFVLLNPPPLRKGGGGGVNEGSLTDRWIMSRLNRLIEETTAHIERYEFSQGGEKLYDFAWHEFADWYLEITKIEGNHELAREVFEAILKLLHPFMPFVTEALWAELKGERDLLMIQEWPEANKKAIDEKAEAEFAKLRARVIELRKQRKDAGLTGKTPLEVKATGFDQEHQAIIERLAMVKL